MVHYLGINIYLIADRITVCVEKVEIVDHSCWILLTKFDDQSL
jgi:hypothetical protein